MDKNEPNKRRKKPPKPQQPPPYKPTEATQLNLVTFTFRPLQAKFL
jgi:hypothetical protein